MASAGGRMDYRSQRRARTAQILGSNPTAACDDETRTSSVHPNGFCVSRPPLSLSLYPDTRDDERSAIGE
ncbi:unnamed protein product [Lampetra planeri]